MTKKQRAHAKLARLLASVMAREESELARERERRVPRTTKRRLRQVERLLLRNKRDAIKS